MYFDYGREDLKQRSRSVIWKLLADFRDDMQLVSQSLMMHLFQCLVYPM